MNASPTPQSGRRPVGRGRAGSVAVIILICLYALLQPRLNQRFGWNLPGLRGDASPQTDSADLAPPGRWAADSQAETDFGHASPPGELKYGLLREIRPGWFLSPEGLRYAPGSAQGHRLEHLRRHTQDQPSRPGKHGVFDGGMEGALATIDRAYGLAKSNQRTTKQTDQDRTIYTIEMGGRVGYIGGRDGNLRHHPDARRVKLVLAGTQVITAYPL